MHTSLFRHQSFISVHTFTHTFTHTRLNVGTMYKEEIKGKGVEVTYKKITPTLSFIYSTYYIFIL